MKIIFNEAELASIVELHIRKLFTVAPEMVVSTVIEKAYSYSKPSATITVSDPATKHEDNDE
mgnify:CR=1 FL=1